MMLGAIIGGAEDLDPLLRSAAAWTRDQVLVTSVVSAGGCLYLLLRQASARLFQWRTVAFSTRESCRTDSNGVTSRVGQPLSAAR